MPLALEWRGLRVAPAAAAARAAIPAARIKPASSLFAHATRTARPQVLGRNDKAQSTLVATWLTELLLDSINRWGARFHQHHAYV